MKTKLIKMTALLLSCFMFVALSIAPVVNATTYYGVCKHGITWAINGDKYQGCATLECVKAAWAAVAGGTASKVLPKATKPATLEPDPEPTTPGLVQLLKPLTSELAVQQASIVVVR